MQQLGRKWMWLSCGGSSSKIGPCFLERGEGEVVGVDDQFTSSSLRRPSSWLPSSLGRLASLAQPSSLGQPSLEQPSLQERRIAFGLTEA